MWPRLFHKAAGRSLFEIKQYILTKLLLNARYSDTMAM